MTALFGLLPPPPARVIEFGCGTGWLAFALGQRGYRVLGVDISPDAVQAARGERDARGLGDVDFQQADYESFDGGGAFDAAVFHDALHHAEDEAAALASAYRALRPEGCVIAIEPGEGHHATSTSRRAVAEFGVHEKDMPPPRIVALGRAAGFRRHLVLPHPHDLNRTLYRRAYHAAGAAGDLRGRRWLSGWRALWQLLGPRRSGLVVLWK
jgi:SAM-dependent methyltransferase